MRKTVLVTGANGFVGSHVLEALQQNGGLRVIAACRDKSKLPGGFDGEVREGKAFALAATTEGLADYEGFNCIGPEAPSTREAISFLCEEFGLPLPHFSIPFVVAYPFAWLMEKIDMIVPWEPLVTRSIVHLLEDVHADNSRAEKMLGYRPVHHWHEAIRTQMLEMADRQLRPMSMARPV